MVKERYLQSAILADLQKKMVFIGGPRQVGKTTLAKFIAEKAYKHPIYLNWDNFEQQKQIRAGRFATQADLLIFDEIHKYRVWKNYIKGIFDTYKDRFDILVTGSARLDLYRKGGDSLLGRYHYYRLHPFSVAEILQTDETLQPFTELTFQPSTAHLGKIFSDLLQFGGFPEAFLSKDSKELRRWHNERLDRLVKEDIRDVELVRDLSSLRILSDILPNKVGSLLSLNALRQDLQVNHKTVALWMDILERFYYHFRIYPWTKTPLKSLRKEPKLYLWDWSQVEDEAARLENMVAAHLLKVAHFLYDAEGYRVELRFLRDVEGREVDFILLVDEKPWLAVEVKINSTELSKHLQYFQKRLKIPFVYQIVGPSNVDFLQKNIRVMSAEVFLTGLV